MGAGFGNRESPSAAECRQDGASTQVVRLPLSGEEEKNQAQLLRPERIQKIEKDKK